MPSCAVLVCRHSTKTVNIARDGISFHVFPSNPTIKEKWVNAIGRGLNWFPNKHSVVCSSHFEPTCFQPKKKENSRRNLYESSVPTLKLVVCCSSKCTEHSMSEKDDNKMESNLTTTRRQIDQPSSSKCDNVGMDVDGNDSWLSQESDSTKNYQNRSLTVQLRCRLCAKDQPYENLKPKTFNNSSSKKCFAEKLKHLGSTLHQFFGDFDNKLLPEIVCDPCNAALETSLKLFLQMENARLFFSKLSGECERQNDEDPLENYSEIMIKEEPIEDNDSEINIKVEIENDTAINEYDSKISIENHEIKSETSEVTISIKKELVDDNDLQIKEENDLEINENDTLINKYDNDISIEDQDIKSEASNDSMIEPQGKVERATSSSTKPKPTRTKSKNPKKRAILPANAPAQTHRTTKKRIRKPKIKKDTEETQREDTSSTYQYLHLDLVKFGTTTDQIRKHMETVCGHDVCSVESLKTSGQYASFKLGIPAKFADLFLAPANWPLDICIEPWKENYQLLVVQEEANMAEMVIKEM